MNNYFTNNFQLFSERFPELAQTVLSQVPFCSDFLSGHKDTDGVFFEQITKECNLVFSKSRTDKWIATENGQLLHSSYDPQKEALRLVTTEQSKSSSAAVFYSFGLGYLPQAFASTYPDKIIAIVEPDVKRLIPSFYAIDWSAILKSPSCVLLLGASVDTATSILEKIGFENSVFFEVKAQMMHDVSYFNKLKTKIAYYKQKNDINNRTLEKFSKRWLRNTCRNIPYMLALDGVETLRNSLKDCPVCILAAGPSLDDILPYISDIKKHSIIICVDTALRACLRTGVEPDFIVLADPQYWNARHLDGLSSPSSVLITEAAAYPSVFRFPCKAVLLCSSLLPLALYIEKKTQPLGRLGAGGSVATTAWDFARLLGSNDIYMAGLDLGFPGKRTHTKGSLFEERAFSNSLRFSPAETDSINALYSAFPFITHDYTGLPVLTDKRMEMYAWWFENNIANDSPERHTMTLTPCGVHIQGITSSSISALTGEILATNKEQLTANQVQLVTFREKLSTLSSVQDKLSASGNEKTEAFIADLKSKLTILQQITQRGLNIAKDAIRTLSIEHTEDKAATIFNHTQKQLSTVDTAIKNEEASDLASLVFPTQKQLDIKFKEFEQSLSSETVNPISKGYIDILQKTCIIYTELLKSISNHFSEF